MIWRVRPATRLCLRRYSTTADPYSNFQKLRAYPFAFDQETAKSFLGIWGALLVNSHMGFIGSLLARYIPGFQGSALQPKRMVPVYFPGWIYDAELQANVEHDARERTALVQIRGGYFPGSNFPKLSTSPLWDVQADQTLIPGQVPNLLSNRTLPWSTGLMHQHGQEISCLPYSIYPLTGLKGVMREEADILPGLSCELSAVREKFSVFRPVLLPVYLAEYEEDALDGEKRSFTMFIGASTPYSGVIAFRNPDSFRDEFDTGVDDAARAMGFHTPDEPDRYSFARHKYVQGVLPSISPPRDISAALEQWIHSQMRDQRTIDKVTEASVVQEDDSDPRIREYDPEDIAEVQLWMDVGGELMMTKRIMQRIQEQLSNVSDPDAPSHLKAPIEALEENAKTLEEKKAESQPAWWTEYLAQKEGKP